MKVVVDRSDLLKAMSRAQSIVERRTTIPILSNVLIEASVDKISLRTTDLDIEVVEKVNATIEQDGNTTVGAHTLHDIVRKLPDGASIQLNVDQVSSRLEVKAGRSRFSLATLPRWLALCSSLAVPARWVVSGPQDGLRFVAASRPKLTAPVVQNRLRS